GMSSWTGQRGLWVEMEGHGREEGIAELDTSRTVGWFTSQYPLYVHLEHSTELGSVLKAVKEQVRAVPQHGIGYGLLRYVCQDQEVQQQVQTVPQPQIGLNYLDQSDQAAASFSELFAAAA